MDFLSLCSTGVLVVWSVVSFIEFILFLLRKSQIFNSKVLQWDLGKYIEKFILQLKFIFYGFFLCKTKVLPLLKMDDSWSLEKLSSLFNLVLDNNKYLNLNSNRYLYRKIIFFHQTYWKLDTWCLFNKKTKSYWGNWLPSEQQKKKTILCSDGPQNHQNTHTTQAQKIVDF